MLHRNKKINDIHEGKWNGVGGKLEPGETPDACAIREIKEETGLTVTKLRLAGLLTAPLFDGVEDHYIYVFEAECKDGKLIDTHKGTLKLVV